jgi:SAM-dependent methyltransferase
VPSPDSIGTVRLPGSFRDPAGHVFVSEGTIYRQIDPAGREAYQRLMQSGLYEALVRHGLLVPHEDLGSPLGQPHATLIRPERVPMVSYPYEWCFSQLRDAALAMLAVAREALKFGMVLKDASAYNIQFLRGRPILIDTLSFEPYAGGPWVAYRQFCQHFYAPLLLWSVTDPRLARLSQVFIDGVPLSLASKLLPRRSWLKPGALLHVHMHAAAEQKLSGESKAATKQGNMTALLESLQSAVSATRWTPKSEWSSYYSDQPSYAPEAFARKLDLVTGWLNRLQPATVWDLGANTGQFSRVAAKQGAQAVALDSDPACVETLYREARAEKLDTLLPLVADLTNPSPAIGWANVERQTLEQRGPADLILALAVVHHLAIGNNVPLAAVADYFARLGRRAIVEFVPKSDPMVQRMLASRADVFESYTVEEFERAFSARFTIEQRAVISTSDRLLYLMTVL